MENGMNLDAFSPAEMAQKAEAVGVKKANLGTANMFALAVLAGVYIALGAVFATTATTGSADLPFGVGKLLAGLAFSLGLILVVVGGAELFTGNTLIIIAFTSRKITLLQLLRNWGIVYAGNFVGGLLTAVIMFFTQQYMSGKGAVGLNILNTAETKTSLGVVQAIALGIMCNLLVCLAVWLCYSARTTTDKILAIFPPITAFVAAGFEHSVANMYFIPIGLLVKNWGNPALFDFIKKTPADFPHITLNNFLLANLLPVTIGNIIGGAVLVGLIYWFIYLRKSS